MKTSFLALLAGLGLSLSATTARGEDPAPVKITPEMQALIVQVLQTLSSMKGDLEAMGIELPPELSRSQANNSTGTATASVTTTAAAEPANTSATSTTTAASSSSINSSGGSGKTGPKSTLLDSSAGSRLNTGHLSTGSLSINGVARLSDTDWRELFSRRQP